MLKKLYKYYCIYIRSFIAKKEKSYKSNRILITKYDHLGDFFLLVPHIEALLKRGYELAILCPKLQKNIIDHLSLPVQYIESKQESISEIKETITKVQNFMPEYAINLSMNLWGGIFVNRSKAKLKLGLLQEKERYVYKGATLFYDKCLSFAPTTHHFEVLKRSFQLFVNAYTVNEQISAKTSNSDSIVIHPYATWKAREWPFYSQLITRLIKKGFKVRIIGLKEEHQRKSWVQNQKLSIINLETISDLLNEIEQASCFIGNDSGPAHYSALCGKVTYVLWGPGFYERIHPKGKNVHIFKEEIDCRPCRQKGDFCYQGSSICLEKISVESVLEKVTNEMHF